MPSALKTPWTWAEVCGTRPDIQRLDRVFAAKDVAVLYFATLTLTAMVWALIITVLSVNDVDSMRAFTIVIFSFAMVVLAVAVTVRRIWIIKYCMVHPAMGILGTPALTSDDGGRGMMAGMVVCFIAAMFTLAAGAVNLIVSHATRGAGVGLCVATTVLLLCSSAFYRKHAGVYLGQVRHMYSVQQSVA